MTEPLLRVKDLVKNFPIRGGVLGREIDRVHAVDGQLHIASPLRGPTVVTVDLPLHA